MEEAVIEAAKAVAAEAAIEVAAAEAFAKGIYVEIFDTSTEI